MRLACVALGILLAMPVVAAAPTQGEFSLSGPLALADGGTLEAPLEGAYMPEASGLTTLDIEAPRVSVSVYEARYVDANLPTGHIGVPNGIVVRSFPLSDVAMRLTGTDHAGWLGMRGPGAHARAQISSATSITPSERSLLGTGDVADDPARANYHQDVDVPHLATEGSPDLTVEGALFLKWSGPDVVIHARENTTTWQTGWTRAPGPVAERVQTWIVLETPEATLHIDGAPMDLLVGEADLAWEGACSFRAAGGSARADGELLTPPVSGDVVVVGALRATLTPEGDAARMTLSGDLVSTNLAASTFVATGGRGAWVWIGLAALVAVATGAAAWKRPRGARLEADDYEQLAGAAMSGGRHDEALRWLRLARARAPKSARLALDEAYLFAETGDTAAALAAFDAIARASTDGEAELAAARIHRAAGRDDEAASALARALRKAPIWLAEIDENDELRPLLARPALANEAQQARRALGESA